MQKPPHPAVEKCTTQSTGDKFWRKPKLLLLRVWRRILAGWIGCSDKKIERSSRLTDGVFTGPADVGPELILQHPKCPGWTQPDSAKCSTCFMTAFYDYHATKTFNIRVDGRDRHGDKVRCISVINRAEQSLIVVIKSMMSRNHDNEQPQWSCRCQLQSGRSD